MNQHFLGVFSALISKKPDEETQEKTVTSDQSGIDSRLILFNDEYNTFDFVIESLQEVCELDVQQAEQITLLAHFKGKATCKKGQKEVLDPMCAKLDNLGIDAEVN